MTTIKNVPTNSLTQFQWHYFLNLQRFMFHLPNNNPNFELIQKYVIRPGNANRKTTIDYKIIFKIKKTLESVINAQKAE